MEALTWLLALLLAAGPTPSPAGTDDPVAVFRDLEGRWQGEFVGYDAAGKELYRLRVTQTYCTCDAETQGVVIEDRAADGSLVRASGANFARRGQDGVIAISCDVLKSNGQRMRHRGQQTRGPSGDHELIWHSASGDRSETFREVVRNDGAARVYEIDGMGRYGDALILMAGRYRRVGDCGKHAQAVCPPQLDPPPAVQP